MTKFADQLFDDLMREHGDTLTAVQRPQTPRRRPGHRPAWIAGIATGAVGAVTAGFMVLGGTPAYAVTQNPDGSVKLTVNKASGITGANSVLRAKGLQIVIVPVGPGCPDLFSQAVPPAAGTKITSATRASQDGSLTVDVTGVPRGLTALVGVETASGRTRMGMALIKGTPPRCVSLPADPPSDGANSGGESGQVQNGQDNGPSFSRAGG